AATAPPSARPFNAARREMPTLHLRLRRDVVRRAQFFRRDVSRAGERADHRAGDAGRDRADAALRCMNGRIRVGWHRAFDFDRLMDRHREADAFFRAAETWMADADRPRAVNLAEVLHRAVRVGHRSFAAEFVETVAVAVAFVAEH